jgi:hypothetical protein
MTPGTLQKELSFAGHLCGTAFTAAARLDRIAIGMLRVALVIVLVWIGGLKFVD